MKRTAILILAFLVIFCLLFVGCSKKSSPDQFEEGLAQLDQYKYDEALKSFSSLTEKDSVGINGFFGNALLDERQLRNFDAFIKYLTIAETDESFAPAQLGLYRMYEYFNLPEEAVQAAFAYINLTEESLEQMRIKIDALFLANQYGRTRKSALESGLFNAHEGERAFIVALTFLKENNFDSAQYYYDLGLDQSEETPYYYATGANYLETAGLIDSSINFSSKAVELSNYDFDISMKHFYRTIRNNYFNAADQLISELQKKGIGDEAVELMKFHKYTAARETNSMRKHFTNFVRITNENYSEAYYEMVLSVAKYEETASIQNIKFTLGRLYKDKYSAVILNYANYIFIRMYARIDDPVRTQGEIDKMPDILRTKNEMRMLYVFQLFNSAQTNEGEKEIAAMIERHKNHSDNLEEIADIYAHQRIKLYDKADNIYQMALEADQWNLSAFEELVNIYRTLKDYDKALKLFEQYPHFEEQYPAISLLKCQCYFEKGETAQGESLFKQSIGVARADLTRFNSVFDVFEIQMKHENLRNFVSLMIELNPNNFDAYIMASKRYIDLKDYEKCKGMSVQAQKLQPENLDARSINAFALYFTGSKESAKEILEDVLVQDRENLFGNLLLSHILAFEGDMTGKGSNLARQAVFLSNSTYREWMNLCYAYYQQGRFDLCRGEALKASSKYNEYPLPFYWMGIAMYKEGKKEAKENLQKAVKIGLPAEYLKTAQDALSKL